MGRLGGVDAGVPVFEQRLDVRVPRPRSGFRMLSALFSQLATSLRASHYPHVGQTRTTERFVRRMSDRETTIAVDDVLDEKIGNPLSRMLAEPRKTAERERGYWRRERDSN